MGNNEQAERKISRRKFLIKSAAATVAVLSGRVVAAKERIPFNQTLLEAWRQGYIRRNPTIFGGIESKERNEIGRITLVRENMDMRVINPDTEVERQLQEQWELYHDWRIRAPLAGEGWGTDFGPAIVATGQNEVYTDQLRIDAPESVLDGRYEAFHPIDRTLLLIRDDTDRLIEKTGGDPEAVTNGFEKILNSFGFDGIAALKSPENYGEWGYVREWNYIAEEWGPPRSVIIMNTATADTFYGFYRTYKALADYSLDGSEETKMRWLIEVSDEIHRRSGLSVGRVGRHYRYIEMNTAQTNSVIMPEYQLAWARIHPKFARVAAEVRGIWGNVIFRQKLYEKGINREKLPDIWKYSSGEYDYEEVIDRNNFLVYLMHSRGIEVYRDNSNQDLINHMTTEAATEVPAGFPIGTGSLYNMAQLNLRSRNWDRAIVTSSRQGPIEPIKGGIYFTEQFGDDAGTQQVIDWGVAVNNGGVFFINIDDEGRYQLRTYEDIKRMTEENKSLRVSIFH